MYVYIKSCFDADYNLFKMTDNYQFTEHLFYRVRFILYMISFNHTVTEI